jgi:hypothetical protein
MKRIISCLFAAGLIMCSLSSCSKKELQDEKFYYGTVQVNVMNLPGIPALDIYLEGQKKLEMSGAILNGGFLALSDKPEKVSVYRAGTKTLIVDTTISVARNGEVALTIVCSDVIGVGKFAGGASGVSIDSCSFRVFNNIPVELIPADIKVAAYLLKDDGNGGYAETGIVLPDFAKDQLHASVVTIAVNDDNGNPVTYYLQFKNQATGEVLPDQYAGGQVLVQTIPGKFMVVTIGARLLRQKYKWQATSAEL